VNLAGSGGTGSVTGEGVDCGEDCSEQYTENTEVSLTAIPLLLNGVALVQARIFAKSL